ncbi:MAG: NHL repeat-containing protein [Planctomycetota bacterium]
MAAIPVADALAAPPYRRQPGPVGSAKVCRVRSFALNGYVRKLDGQWQGIRYASDGNVYFASSTHAHDHGGAVFRYDPRSGKLKMLCEDISRVCGEDPTRSTPQGKIHSDFVESNGWIYFATHLACYWPAAADAYTGSHLVGLEMKTGRFRDFGILKPGFSCYSGLGVDPAGRYAYAILMSWAKRLRPAGTHVTRTDLRTGRTVDLGPLPGKQRSSCAHVFVDRRGDCWFTPGGGLHVARAATGKVEALPDALSALRLPGSENTGSARGWFWGEPLGDGDRYVCMMYVRRLGNVLYEFNAARMPDAAAAFRPLAAVGPASPAVAWTADRVYYRQRASGSRRPKGDDHHLMSVSLAGPDRGAVTDHGLILDQDGRRPWRFAGLAADGKGKLFFVGDWWLNGDEKGTLRLSYRWQPGSGEAPFYDEMWRGQFFAVADLAKPRPGAAKP